MKILRKWLKMLKPMLALIKPKKSWWKLKMLLMA